MFEKKLNKRENKKQMVLNGAIHQGEGLVSLANKKCAKKNDQRKQNLIKIILEKMFYQDLEIFRRFLLKEKKIAAKRNEIFSKKKFQRDFICKFSPRVQ